LGHPILGEVFYAHDAAEYAAPRLHLHSQSLTIYHPSTQEVITFTDPAPF
jgi:tRNA pseudouridine32 synthase/23S rRNA pseudouridine746 synthase